MSEGEGVRGGERWEVSRGKGERERKVRTRSSRLLASWLEEERGTKEEQRLTLVRYRNMVEHLS